MTGIRIDGVGLFTGSPEECAQFAVHMQRLNAAAKPKPHPDSPAGKVQRAVEQFAAMMTSPPADTVNLNAQREERARSLIDIMDEVRKTPLKVIDATALARRVGVKDSRGLGGPMIVALRLIRSAISFPDEVRSLEQAQVLARTKRGNSTFWSVGPRFEEALYVIFPDRRPAPEPFPFDPTPTVPASGRQGGGPLVRLQAANPLTDRTRFGTA